MKIAAYCILVLSSLLMLLWPIAAYTTIFLFDAPGGKAFFELKRYAMVVGLLSYPLGTVVGIARILARKKGESWWNKLTLIFLLFPFVQLGLLYLAALAFGK
jgi:hypothetical protein